MKKYINGLEEYKLDKDDLTQDLIDYVENTRPKTNYLDIRNVYQEDLFLNKSILQFEESDGSRVNICNVIDLEDGMNKMKKIFKDSGFEKNYYNRIIEYDDYYKIDYGSHRCFFIVTKEVL
ncbi:hypothetical protein [Staphylococcus phage vB_SurM-PSU4]|nr:hypothetical protein [Staphylococcus phage vB_SurM-PSU4]